MKYLVKFTFWNNETDIRTIEAENCHVLQGVLVGINNNKNIELLSVEPINAK